MCCEHASIPADNPEIFYRGSVTGATPGANAVSVRFVRFVRGPTHCSLLRSVSEWCVTETVSFVVVLMFSCWLPQDSSHYDYIYIAPILAVLLVG